jgi:hypothetical protein
MVLGRSWTQVYLPGEPQLASNAARIPTHEQRQNRFTPMMYAAGVPWSTRDRAAGNNTQRALLAPPLSLLILLHDTPRSAGIDAREMK